jgi:plasmid rolling circle replication initiator protein Rep
MLDPNSAAVAAIAQVPSVTTETNRYLTDYSPQDKPWDKHRAQAQQVEGIYSGTVFDALAGRIRGCSGYLGFGWEVNSETGEMKLRLKQAEFCRVRHCPVCQWRRSLMWQSRFLKALPSIEQAYPSAQWLFLTLTVRNCDITDLRATIQEMNKAWHRLVKRREFGAVLGWIRTTEVTKGQDGLAHPHFHALLMVRPSYFSSKYYVTHERWVELWQECARLDYRPSVRIEAVKSKPGRRRSSTESPLRRAVAETLKYSVKPEDLTDRDWLLELTKQVFKLRFIASGGALRDVLRETEETERDLLLADEDAEGEGGEPDIWFDWRREVRRYVKR